MNSTMAERKFKAHHSEKTKSTMMKKGYKICYDEKKI